MKRTLVILLLTVATWVQAKPVDMPTLLQVLAHVRNATTPQSITMQRIGNEMVLFNWDNGFALLSTDDCVRPLLAYSHHNNASLDNMPPNVAQWLEAYRRDIAAKVACGIPQSPQVAAEWQRLCSASPKGGIATKRTPLAVDPLVSTTWNQFPLYNLHCPYDTEHATYTMAGCVATAMTQIMKRWNHPTVGWGSAQYEDHIYGTQQALFDTTHYRWEQMPTALDSTSTPDQVEAVAELMYHTGVAVQMRYGPRASGAYTSSYGDINMPSAEQALRTYFRYNPLLYDAFKTEYTDTEWDNLLHCELEAGRPVLYSGTDSAGGHAFVLDGCDTLGLFHINWGWGGRNDGYYTIDSLSPGSGGAGGNATYTFNMNNHAIVGIEPVATAAGATATIHMLSDTAKGYVVGNGTYTVGSDTVSIEVQAHSGYRFVGWASGNPNNPMHIIAMSDIIDSALFLPVEGDTLGYCNNALYQAWQDDYGPITKWGIRLPASLRGSHREITAVQLYLYTPGRYIVSVLQGNHPDQSTQLHSQLIAGNATGWQTFYFDHPVPLSDTSDVWLTVWHDGMDFPATYSRYSGVADGSWYHLPDGWAPYCEQGVYASWMLRAVLHNAAPVGIEAAAPATIAPSIMGHTVVCPEPCTAYDMQGRPVGYGTRFVLPKRGVYIIRCGSSATRILIL